MNVIKNITLPVLLLLSVNAVSAWELTPKMVTAKNFFLEYASLPVASLKSGCQHVKQLYSEVDFQKVSEAAKRLGMTLEEAAVHYGKKAMTLPELAKKALAEQQILNHKATKITAAVTIASVIGGVVYKYDLHKKAYNGLVTLKNKVFGKSVQK